MSELTEKPAIEGGKPVRKKPLIFGKPFLGKREISAVAKTIKSGWVGQGPKTKEFEERFKKFIGCSEAVSVSSCTAGLHLSLLATGQKNRNEVITTPLTFASTANAIVNSNSRPVFVDIDKETLNIDAGLIEEKINGKKTNAIVPVHFCGEPCEMKKIFEIADEKQLFIIEDAAHAIGSSYNGKKIGSFGFLVCFSFAHNKIITTIEGGMVTSNNKEFLEKIKTLREHGLSTSQWERFHATNPTPGEIIAPGFKYYLNDVQASIGLEQMKNIEKILLKRQKIAKIYQNAFKDTGFLKLQKYSLQNKQSRQFFPIILETEKLKINRNKFVSALRKENIFATASFTALHLHPFYKKEFGFEKGDFPNAEYASERIISLPLNNDMEKKDAFDTITAVEKLIDYYKK